MSPARAKRRCSVPGCTRRIVGRSKCGPHERQAKERYDARRGTSASRGYGARHREWRDAVLRRDPVCVLCEVEPSTVADHVVPIKQGGSRFDARNGQGLCHGCHNRKTAHDGSRG